MSELVVSKVSARRILLVDPATGRRANLRPSKWSAKGTLYVSAEGLTLERSRFFGGTETLAYIVRRDILSLVESWRPILAGGGRLRFSDETYRYEFRLPTATDANDARLVLTTDPAEHRAVRGRR